MRKWKSASPGKQFKDCIEKKCDLVAVYMQLSGIEAKRPCSRCLKRVGPWDTCVVTDDAATLLTYRDACSCCVWGSKATLCSLRQGIRSPRELKPTQSGNVDQRNDIDRGTKLLYRQHQNENTAHTRRQPYLLPRNPLAEDKEENSGTGGMEVGLEISMHAREQALEVCALEVCALIRAVDGGLEEMLQWSAPAARKEDMRVLWGLLLKKAGDMRSIMSK